MPSTDSIAARTGVPVANDTERSSAIVKMSPWSTSCSSADEPHEWRMVDASLMRNTPIGYSTPPSTQTGRSRLEK